MCDPVFECAFLHVLSFVLYTGINLRIIIILAVGQGFGTERSEQYRPGDSRTATLDLKGRRKGSVPIADTDEDRMGYGAHDPGHYEHGGEVGSSAVIS